MIKLIVGTKGSGKTKAMIDQINDAVKTSKGNVVVVEKGMKLTYDIAPAARLIDLEEYKISGGEMLYGFVAGLMANNYDITDLYIDGILKELDHDINRLGVVLDEMAAIAGDTVKVTDGPLAGFLGTVEELEPDKDRVRVVVSMFGRETPVDLELDQVEEIKE